MSSRFAFVAVHGVLEIAAARKLLHALHADEPGTTYWSTHSERDFWDSVRKRYVNMAKAGHRILALVDLEQRSCAPALIRGEVPAQLPPTLVLRVAVRMLESWLLADRRSAARFFGIPTGKLPPSPDDEPHPKRLLVNLARKHSPARVRSDLVPREGMSGAVGAGYRSCLERYIFDAWTPDAAALNSPSLQRAIEAIKRTLPS